jgi:hypothetical protein
MGAVKKLFKAVAKVIAPTPKVTAPTVAKAAVEKAQTAKAAVAKGVTGGSLYGGSTIMSGAGGVEEEANVAKTVLGGTKKKVKNLMGEGGA